MGGVGDWMGWALGAQQIDGTRTIGFSGKFGVFSCIFCTNFILEIRIWSNCGGFGGGRSLDSSETLEFGTMKIVTVNRGTQKIDLQSEFRFQGGNN